MARLIEQVNCAVTAIRDRESRPPEIGVILGSGLGQLSEAVIDANRIPYSTVPGFPRTNVAGHRGEIVVGSRGGKTLAILNGRTHYYEGCHPARVTFPVRVLRGLGCHTLIVTNAAGGLNPDFHVGDLMLIDDHIDIVGLSGGNPLRGRHDPELGPQFVDMTEPYDVELRELACQVAAQAGLSLRHGVYARVSGPSYETPTELRFLRAAGADAVGMSTAAEVVVARQCGLRVLGVSCIANMATGGHHGRTSHADVLTAMAAASVKMVDLVSRLIEAL